MSRIDDLEKQLVITTLQGRNTKALLIRTAIRREKLIKVVNEQHGIDQGPLYRKLKEKSST